MRMAILNSTLLLGMMMCYGQIQAAESTAAQSRSLVISPTGLVASEHPLASQAGIGMLAAGGNAVDAAIAANAAMGVLSPMMCGIGGDLFAIVYEAKTRRYYGINGSGWAPAQFNLEWLREKGLTNIPLHGIEAVTVPGTVDAWDKLLKRFGQLTFREVLQPAIRYAEQGFPVAEKSAGYWSGTTAMLQKQPNAARTFLLDGQPPREGDLFKNPDLAWSYRAIAAEGREAFYTGPIAQKILALSHQLKGPLRPADLAEYQAEWTAPISTTYRGWTVYELPPNGQGIAALMMLNLMEKFDLKASGHNSAETLHLLIEAKKLAYADLLRYVADPSQAAIPVEGLISKSYAAERIRTLDPALAKSHYDSGQPPVGADTTYLCAVDREGNMVSLIQSVYYLFGTGLVPEGAGFVLQNRGALFQLDPNHPNALRGRKRPLHTIIPAFMAREGVRIAFGIMGGWNQAQAHAQFVANVADFDLNIQAALEAPRFTKLDFEGNKVELESRIPESVAEALRAKGHLPQRQTAWSQNVGGGQAVMRDERRRLNFGASDPRKDGAAIPEPY